MTKREAPIYKVIFLNQGQVFEMYAKQIYQSDLWGFLEVEEFVFGERTQVVNSYIGPYTSVSSDCEIRDAELEHSVVLEQSRIAGISGLTDSLIGREVVVERSGQRPRATRLMLGDHSRIDLE